MYTLSQQVKYCQNIYGYEACEETQKNIYY